MQSRLFSPQMMFVRGCEHFAGNLWQGWEATAGTNSTKPRKTLFAVPVQGLENGSSPGVRILFLVLPLITPSTLPCLQNSPNLEETLFLPVTLCELMSKPSL